MSQPLATHFTMLIYPFSHTAAGGKRNKRLSKLSNHWMPWWQRLGNDACSRAFDDSFFFLPYVRELLFADAAAYPASEKDRALEQLASATTADLAHQANQHGVMRLTLREAAQEVKLRVTLEKGDAVLTDFCIEWIDALLFPQSVGFLVIKVCLTTPGVSAEHVRDTLRQLRQVIPSIPGRELALWRIHDMPNVPPLPIRTLLDGWLADLTAPSGQPMMPASFTSSAYGQVYGQTFRLYSYACLAHEPLSDDSTQAPFANQIERTLWELATCSDTNDPDYAPHADHVRGLMGAGQLKLWHNWQGLALHDNVVFLANNASDFTRESFPHNVEAEYLQLYLLTLYQKIRLNLMLGESMREGKRSVIGEQVRRSRELVENLVQFRNLYWLTEVTFRPQGATIYQRFREGLGSAALFKAVSAEVGSLQGYYESFLQRGTNTLVNLLTFIGVPITVMTSIYNTNLFPEQSWLGFVLWLGAVIGSGWLLLRLFQFYLERRKVR